MDDENIRVMGLHNGSFYYIHITALICILFSFIGSVFVLVSSFQLQQKKAFFTWGKSDRFIVYLALCDGLFNISHTLDHVQMAVTRDHVHPVYLCGFYAFLLMEFVTAQFLLNFLIAVNAFLMMKFRYAINFGKRDWKLILYAFGTPLIIATICAGLGRLGATGTYCGIQGRMTTMVLSTIPVVTELLIISVLYTLTWYHIRKETKQMSHLKGRRSTLGYHSAAKIMTLFVVAFVAQWWPLAVYGVVKLSSAAGSQIFFQMVVTICNLGGLFHCLVFLTMQHIKNRNKRSLRKHKDDKRRYAIFYINTDGLASC